MTRISFIWENLNCVNRLTVAILLFWSCHNTTNNNSLLSELLRDGDGKYGLNFDNPTGVFILNETGCITCNRQLLQYIVDEAANKDNILIYSTASGMRLDISSFLSDTIKNYIEGDQSKLIKYNLYEGSYFIYFKNRQIDTLIPIRAIDLDRSLLFIENLTLSKK